MRILITGATGLVGRELVKLCREEQIEVHFLSTSKEKLNSIPGAQGFYWNPREEEIDLHCFDKVTEIVNLAGAPIAKRWTKSYKKKIISSRVQSLKTLRKGLSLAGNTTINTFVSASAIGIYPDSPDTFYTEEERFKAKGFAAEVVEHWEAEAARFKDLVPQLAILRIGLVLSADGGALPQMVRPVKLYAGAAFGSGKQWQSWIHIRDLSRMIHFILQNRLNGVFNAVAPNPVTQIKLLKEVAKVHDRPLFLPGIPKFVLRLLLGEMSTIVLSSQRVSCKKIESHGFDFEYQNICRALEEIYRSDS
jgi:uncharacterized protein (TIGR01777 family)